MKINIINMRTIILILGLSFLAGCANSTVGVVLDQSLETISNSNNTINGFFPTVTERDVAMYAGSEFVRSSNTPFLAGELLDTLVCTNNVSIILYAFKVKTGGSLITLELFEEPNITSTGIAIPNTAVNSLRYDNKTSNLSFFVAPTIIDDGLFVFADVGIGSNQIAALPIDVDGSLLLRMQTCYIFRVTNGDNQPQLIYSNFVWAETLQTNFTQFGNNIRDTFEDIG